MHGNPNVLTQDCGTSRLSQGCVGQISLIELEKMSRPVAPHRAFEAPT